MGLEIRDNRQGWGSVPGGLFRAVGRTVAFTQGELGIGGFVPGKICSNLKESLKLPRRE